jgi:hypothetical protein
MNTTSYRALAATGVGGRPGRRAPRDRDRLWDIFIRRYEHRSSQGES